VPRRNWRWTVERRTHCEIAAKRPAIVNWSASIRLIIISLPLARALYKAKSSSAKYRKMPTEGMPSCNFGARLGPSARSING
jgi:hypothetical protein